MTKEALFGNEMPYALYFVAVEHLYWGEMEHKIGHDREQWQ
jgi:hypothetical protein